MASINRNPLSMETINSKIKNCEYALGGELANHAQLVEDEIKKNPGSHPFDEVLNCSIGNPQARGQQPITYFREVLALCEYPELINAHHQFQGLFCSESIQKAKEIMSLLPNRTTGASSDSRGIRGIRDAVAAGITERDGYPTTGDNVFLTDGSSAAANLMIRLLIKKDNDGILLPIPDHPLYSAKLTLYGGRVIPYYLKEENEWTIETLDLKRRLEEARTENIAVKAMVIINPGNPTGQVYSVDSQRILIEFCRKEGLVLIADEVYQDNIYPNDKKFNSFKKVTLSTGYGPSDITIVSFHSVSKGYCGESGKRGGYMELFGVDDDVKEQLHKLASVDIAPNLPGQILTSLMMNPPKVGDSCYKRYMTERETNLSLLARNLEKLRDVLNRLEGVTCNNVEGSMYLFPRILFPDKAIEASTASGTKPDAFYARKLLDSTGIVVIPGSGFGQVYGTWHIRFTIPPIEDNIAKLIDRLETFHKSFMEENR